MSEFIDLYILHLYTRVDKETEQVFACFYCLDELGTTYYFEFKNDVDIYIIDRMKNGKMTPEDTMLLEKEFRTFMQTNSKRGKASDNAPSFTRHKAKLFKHYQESEQWFLKCTTDNNQVLQQIKNWANSKTKP